MGSTCCLTALPWWWDCVLLSWFAGNPPGGRGRWAGLHSFITTIDHSFPPLPLCTRLYSFGYGRVEVLSGFVNSLFLVSIATVVLSEALTRLLDPPTINTDKLLVCQIVYQTHCLLVV